MDRKELANFLRRHRDTLQPIHPAVGRIEFDCQVLFSENRAQLLVVMTARSGAGRSKLELLSVAGAQQLSG